MMHLLIARSPEYGLDVFSELTQWNINLLIHPFFHYQALEAPPIHPCDFDKIIFVSMAAVKYSEVWRKQIPEVMVLYAIGPSTQAALQQQHAQVRIPKAYTSEGLLTLPEFQLIQNQRILIVRGCSGREFLAERLKARGAEVNYLEVYDRIFNPLAPESLQVATDFWVTSEMNLVHFAKQTPRRELRLWVSSQRLMSCAEQLGFEKKVLLTDATPAALIEGLKHGNI